MGRLLLVVLVVLSGGAALSAPSELWKDAVKTTVQGMTLDEIIQWSDAQFRKQATIGRYVRWSGSIVLGAALVAAGLDYFYNYLKRETGTSLDQWYRWDSQVAAALGEIWGVKQGDWCYYSYRFESYRFSLPGGQVGGTKGGSLYGDCKVPEGAFQLFLRDVPSPYNTWRFRSVGPSDPVPSWAQYVLVPGDRPPLSEWLQAHPDAANGVKQAVQTYIDSTPIGSPSQPWPGIQLLPVPNPNQWTDNPFTRPDIDTDGDGYPDAVEWQEANRRGVPWPDLINNPDVYPDPKADPDGDGFTTGEEVAVGTDPYDANSSPRVRPAPSIDTDGDTWPDAEEIKRGTDPRSPDSRPYNLPYNQDSDGDGAPDWKEIEAGTDPYSPDSQPQPDPNEQPKDEPQWPGGPPVPGLKPVELPTRQAERKPLPELDRLLGPWEEQVVQRWQEAVDQLKGTLANKFPFALVLALSRVSVERGSAQCTFPVTIGPVQATISPCDTPVFQTMETFRPILAGLFWLTFVLTLVRRGLDIQG